MKRNLDQYQFTVRPLSKEEGGGYFVEHPDIPGCMSGGETIQEANREWPRSSPRLYQSVPGIGPKDTNAWHRARSIASACAQDALLKADEAS